MDIFLQNKKTVVGIVVLILVFFAYSAFFSPTPDPEAETFATAENENLVDTAEELSSITFRQDLFATPGYRLLIDFSTSVSPQPTGRLNPFDIIGRD